MAKYYYYLFPTDMITVDDVKAMYRYKLEPQGMFYMANDEDNFPVLGTKANLEKFADDWFGYELHPAYLYKEEYLDLEDFEEHTSDDKGILAVLLANSIIPMMNKSKKRNMRK